MCPHARARWFRTAHSARQELPNAIVGWDASWPSSQLDAHLVLLLGVLGRHDPVALDDGRKLGAQRLDFCEHVLGNPCREGVDDGWRACQVTVHLPTGCSRTVLVRNLCSLGVLYLLLRFLEQVARCTVGEADDDIVESGCDGHGNGGEQHSQKCREGEVHGCWSSRGMRQPQVK